MWTCEFWEIGTSACTDAPDAEIFSRTTVALRSRDASSGQRSITRSEQRKRGSLRLSRMPGSVRSEEAREFEERGIVAALGQLAHALFDRITDGFNPSQRQRFGRIDFERDELTGQ